MIPERLRARVPLVLCAAIFMFTDTAPAFGRRPVVGVLALGGHATA